MSPRQFTGLTGSSIALLAVVAGASPLEIDAGALRAHFEVDPARIVFTDASGRTALAEAADLGPGPAGPVGFRTAAGWYHATRLTGVQRRGDSLAAVAETTDPSGRRLSVELRADAEGVITLTARITHGPLDDVEGLGIGFDALPNERFLGFGERANAVDQRGQVVENYVADGPYQPDERDLV
jgi:hypothetical protein